MEKGFDCGIGIPHTIGYWDKCMKNTACDKCDKLVNETKEFWENLNELKRLSPNSFGHMLPWYVGDLEEYTQRFSNLN